MIADQDIIIVDHMRRDLSVAERLYLPQIAAGLSVTLRHLFRFDSVRSRRTELLFFMTPHVIRTPEEAERMADGLLELINLERVSAVQPLPPVSHSPILSDIASSYACRMIEGDFFGHRDPDTGRSPGQRAIAGKYRFFAVGENLAAGLETPAEVMRVWMESPSHRRIILDPTWEEAGVGVRAGGAHGVYWVLEFGDPID